MKHVRYPFLQTALYAAVALSGIYAVSVLAVEPDQPVSVASNTAGPDLELSQCGSSSQLVAVADDAPKSDAASGASAASPTMGPALDPVAAALDQPVKTVPGMPAVINPANLYSEATAGKLSPAVAGALSRVYVPNVKSNDVYVIDPATFKVVSRFKVGANPQHVVPSWDLKTLWVANNAEGTPNGSLTPIDPDTGKPGTAVKVDDPYNMYFTPDGKSAVVVAEALKRLDFRDPHTMALQFSLPTPGCAGINHADYSIDGRYAIFTCEFDGGLVKIDMVKHEVLGYLKLAKGGMPQDIRSSPDGKIFYVADMMADGVYVIDGADFKKVGFIKTGVGTHGLYPSRDGTKLYITNRGSNKIHGKPKGPGSISVLDFATGKVVATWPIPGGGSPDMGNVSADGKYLWISGRFDNVVYAINTTSGAVKVIRVGLSPMA